MTASSRILITDKTTVGVEIYWSTTNIKQFSVCFFNSVWSEQQCLCHSETKFTRRLNSNYEPWGKLSKTSDSRGADNDHRFAHEHLLPSQGSQRGHRMSTNNNIIQFTQHATTTNNNIIQITIVFSSLKEHTMSASNSIIQFSQHAMSTKNSIIHFTDSSLLKLHLNYCWVTTTASKLLLYD